MSTLHDDWPINEKYGPAMELETQEEADAYFERLIQYDLERGKTRAEAEKLERTNLGYYAGYYSHETRERVERLFKCVHPVFGSIAEKGPPTFDEALQKGITLGKRQRAVLDARERIARGGE